MRSRNNALEALLDELSGISDKEYQRRVWIRGEGPECDDFDETVCRYFDEIDEVLEKKTDFGLLDNQYLILRKFHKEFQIFCKGPALEYYLPQVFIDTPEWTKITEMAQEVLIVFNWKNSSTTAEHPSLNRSRTFEYFLRDIAGLSVKKPEQGIWLLAEGKEPDNFKETVSRYFKTADSILEEYKDYGISDTQLQILRKFHEAFSKFWKSYDLPHLFLHTAEWMAITEMAKDVLKAFNYNETEKY